MPPLHSVSSATLFTSHRNPPLLTRGFDTQMSVDGSPKKKRGMTEFFNACDAVYLRRARDVNGHRLDPVVRQQVSRPPLSGRRGGTGVGVVVDGEKNGSLGRVPGRWPA